MNDKVRNARKTDQEWMNLIQECRVSGFGDKDWCEQHGIPISTFYTKITRLRKKACEIPSAKHRVIRETQHVVPLQVVDEVPEIYKNEIPVANETSPAVVLKVNGYCVEISNDAARDTILNTLFVLQQLC
ncbi:MAG: IS66 family insertion sequence element accessory protein TnpB [Clostridium sp.]